MLRSTASATIDRCAVVVRAAPQAALAAGDRLATGVTQLFDLTAQRRRRAFRCTLASLVVTALCGCVTPTTTTNKVHVDVEVLNATQRLELKYLVQPGDQLDIFLDKQPQFSRKVTVRSDGYVSLPLIDEVKAAGKTPMALAEELKKLFSKRLLNPEVNVAVLNPPEPMVYVVGQVGQPRALPLRQASTVAQALAQSGDALKSGELADISVIRLNSEGYLESLTLKLDGVDPQHVSQPDLYMAMGTLSLKPNDLILIPQSYRSQVMQVLSDVSIAMAPLFNVLLLYKLY